MRTYAFGGFFLRTTALVLTLNVACFTATVSAATIFVGDYNGGKIESYSSTGTDLGAFVTAGSGGLSAPGGFTFGPDGNLYVASRGTGSILEYDGTTGAFIGTFSSPSGAGAPDDIKFGSNGNAYVAASSGFYILNGTTGAVLSSVGTGTSSYGETFLPSNGDFLLSQIGSGTVVEYTLGGVLVGTYATGGGEPVGLAVGADGRVYGADQSGTVAVAPLAGGAMSTFASGFSTPEYLALLGGTLYLTDYNAKTVDLLDGSGTVTGSFSTAFSPYGIAVQADAPEPASLSLLGLGLGSCLLLRRRARR
jgi:hypothetical protein